MILSTSIRSWFEHRIQWVKMNPLLTVLWSLLFLLLAAFMAVMLSENPCWISPYLDLYEKNEILKFLGISMGGILLALQAVIANRRAKAMENAANAQAEANRNTERGQRQERLKNAIEHLGYSSDSVRLGGAYELFHLAHDTPDLRQTILDILCAHIRRETGEAVYREKYPSKPSEEVQSLLTLLFVQKYKIFKACHINLQGSWLNGADLKRAHLEKAVLQKAHLHKANLGSAHLQGAHLYATHLQGAHLGEAHLQGAHLEEAHLQGAHLGEAHLQGAHLEEAHLQGARLGEAHLQGTFLEEAHLQGVSSGRGFPVEFAENMREGIGRQSDLSGVTFAGGLSQEDVDLLAKDLSDEEANKLRERLTPHIGMPESNELPKDSGAVTGAYTEEEAEQWISEYEGDIWRFQRRTTSDADPALADA